MNRIQYFLALLFIVIATSCTSEDKNHSEETTTNTLTIQLNGQEIVLNSPSNFTANENCKRVSATGTFSIGTEDYRIMFELTDSGKIIKVELIDYQSDKSYKTASFIAAQHFDISNFIYNPSANHLTFNYVGTLFDTQNSQNTLTISGDADFSDFQSVACTYNPWVLTAQINGYTFDNAYAYNVGVMPENKWFFFCDNGYNIVLELEQPITEMPIGEYIFTPTNNNNTITFEKYIGDTESSNFETPQKLPEEWQTFTTEGSFEITERYTDTRGILVINGTFSFNAYDDASVLVYQISNGTFSL